MSRKAIKFKHQLKSFFHYFQKLHWINKPNSLSPQWSRQAVITISRSTWKTKNKSMESPPIFFVYVWLDTEKIYLSIKIKIN